MRKLNAVVFVCVFLCGLAYGKENTKKITELMDNLKIISSKESYKKKINQLIEIGKKNPKVINLLIKALDEKNEDCFRLNAAYVLGQIGSKALNAKKPLIAVVQRKYDDSSVRISAAEAIVKIGFKSEVLPLLRTMLKENNVSLRKEAIGLLSRLGRENPQAIYSALKCYKRMGDCNDEILAFMEKVRKKKYLSHYLSALKMAYDDPNNQVRSLAATLIYKLGNKASPLLPDLISGLKWTQTDFNDQTRYTLKAILTMGKSSTKALLPMIKAYKEADVEETQSDIEIHIQLILKRYPKESQGPLIKALEDKDSSIRDFASEQLVQFGKKMVKVIHALTKTLLDDEASTRENSAMALKNMDVKPSILVPALIKSVGKSKDLDQYDYGDDNEEN